MLRTQTARSFLLLVALASPATSFAQEGGPPIDLPPPRVEKETTEDDVILASDGKPATAGRIPEHTPKDAAELWALMVESVTIGGEDPGASTVAPAAFELEFNVKQRTDEGSNEFRARFAYLDHGPGLVRGTILDDSGRERSTSMRGVSRSGAKQYWYRKVQGEATTDGWVKLTRNENPEDRDRVDTWAAISYDIARLARPNSFRIVELTERRVAAITSDDGDEPFPGLVQFEGDAGVLLPPNDVNGVKNGRKTLLSELAAGLRWLELETPDFRDFRGSGRAARRQPLERDLGPKTHRLVFGIDPGSAQPQIVIVAPGAAGPLQVPGTALIQCTDWFAHPEGAEPQQQNWLPGRFFAYETVEAPRGAPTRFRFDERPVTDLYLLNEGSMDAKLTPEDFLPK